ncbi:MAG: DUF3857 domain-containing protein [Myxococcota bacterium]|nr:DUF3857 domain-containing protein [Myxococcota bacterium]
MRHRRLRSALVAALALGSTLSSLGATSFGSTAHAQPEAVRPANPYDAEQRRLAAEVARDRSPRGFLALLELWRHSDDATPAVTTRLLDELAKNRRLLADRRAYAAALLARMQVRAGDRDAAQRTIAPLGYATDWQLVGPFDNEGKQGFARAFGPEELRMAAHEPARAFDGKERDVAWRRHPPLDPYGYVDLDMLFRPNRDVCGYATTVVRSERAQPLTLHFGAGGASRVWWNGVVVHEDPTYRQPDADRHALVVGAHAGDNRILVKTCVANESWGFYLRVLDARGVAVAVDAENMPTAAGEGHGVPRLPTAPRSTLTLLEEASAAANARPSAHYDLARFLLWTGADDVATNRARQLAARAADADPSLDHLVLAARLQEHRHERQRYATRALERFPNDAEALVLMAQIASTGFHPESALAYLDRVGAGDPIPGVGGVSRRQIQTIAAALVRAEILQRMELPQAARATVERALEGAGEAPGWLVVRATHAESAVAPDDAIALRTRALAQRHDDVALHQIFVADAVRRRERDRAVTHLDAIREAAPGDVGVLRYVAAIHEALGRNDEALEAFTAALQLAPEDPGTHVAYGKLLLRAGQADAALGAFRTALDLRPQDASTRELLEQIRPQQRPDEAYAANDETILARRGESQGFPVTTLQDLTVNTVFENGLGSSFRQVAWQVHDQEGARSLRTYAIQWDPTAQRVDLRLARVYRGNQRLEATQLFEQALGEPWYRIYYDTRAMVVVFPTLEPGDVVELRWRIDDVAHRNLFADYYGDLTFLQDMQPSAHQEYVLITPSSRQFYFSEPNLPQLRHERREENGARVDRFVAEDVPAIRSEDSMPGYTEISPYLHVSTYRTWEEVGRWYWGLIQDQLYADESLKATVRQLVEGKTELRDKVEAIHQWVLDHTRYVGLEFGIHGYKPYRVPQILSRGFGDCKDKASVLYTMFREAGIDAHIILVRTRRNGLIDDLPASLAVFDHAIAYVPELDLYIDGTAEHSGLTELPDMDQGVTVLHVWPGGSELRRTPVLPPERNRRERTLDVRLAADGSASLSAREVITGSQAPGYRSTYQAEGTRRDRLERELRNLFAGLRLESQRFEHLDDLERPVHLQWEAEVPQLAPRDAEGLRVDPSVIGELTRSLARATQRRLPLELGTTSSYVETRTVHLPAGARARTIPEGRVAESPFGLVRLTVESDARKVELRTELELRRDRVAPNEYGAFRRWLEEADQILRQRLVVEPR